MEGPKKPFWRTLPGILTEIAGVVTAFGAIAGVAVQARTRRRRRLQVDDAGAVEPLRKAAGRRAKPAAVGLGAQGERHLREGDQVVPPAPEADVDRTAEEAARHRLAQGRAGSRPRAAAGREREIHEVRQLDRRANGGSRRALPADQADAHNRRDLRQGSQRAARADSRREPRADTLAVELGATVCAQEPY